MTKDERLNHLRARAKARPALSENAAATLEQLRKDDPDLGGETFGEVLPPEKIKRDRPPRTEDESELNTEVVSPAMLAAMES